MECCKDIEGVSERTVSKQASRIRRNRIPESLMNDPLLKEACAVLPGNYNFEIPKTIWKIREHLAFSAEGLVGGQKNDKKEKIALQFPEGLLMYSCVISDVLKRFTENCDFVILGDVTYGACCIDDLSARALGCSMMVHYGHSCLVPVSSTCLKCLYIFVEISIDVAHMVHCITKTFPSDAKICLLGTIQFVGSLQPAKNMLEKYFSNEPAVPQAKPLSSGEVLGCTSPLIKDADCLVFVADGRFHLESAMIQNPEMAHFRYDPYSKILSREGYDQSKMKRIRLDAVLESKSACSFGIILGTLGRQGNPKILDRLIDLLQRHKKQFFVLLLSEISPAKLAKVRVVEAWIQVACPRLSIDWGHFFDKPLLSPYEAEVCLGEAEWKEIYPMDFYAKDGGAWSNKLR